MVPKRPNSKDPVSVRNSNIRISLILEKYRENSSSRIDIVGGQKMNLPSRIWQKFTNNFSSENFFP